MKSAQQDVITAEAQVEQQEMILKSVLTRSGLDTLAIATARIVPTDNFKTPAAEPVLPLQDLVGEAFANRVEIEQNQINLENARINTLGTKNALLPTLQAFVNLQNNGQSGQVNDIPIAVTVNGQTTYITRTASSVNPYFLGSYGTALGQIFGRNFPNYTAGLQLSIPLRNRAAQADLITDELNYRQSQIQDKQLRNGIKLNVINSAVALTQARAAYDTSVQARKLQEQTLAGERRRYELGASTILNILIVQRDTTTREIAEVQALNQYIRARTAYEQVLGHILKAYDVDVQDAASGVVKRDPDLIPVIDQPNGRGGSR
jgi:outer membrane protein